MWGVCVIVIHSWGSVLVKTLCLIYVYKGHHVASGGTSILHVVRAAPGGTQVVSRWCEVGPRWCRVVPSGAKWYQGSVGWCQVVPGWCRVVPSGSKVVSTGTKWCQVVPRWQQVVADGKRWRQMVPHGHEGNELGSEGNRRRTTKGMEAIREALVLWWLMTLGHDTVHDIPALPV